MSYNSFRKGETSDNVSGGYSFDTSLVALSNSQKKKIKKKSSFLLFILFSLVVFDSLLLFAYISLLRVVENVESVSGKQVFPEDITAERTDDFSKATQDNVHEPSVDDIFYNYLLKSGL